MIVDVSSDQTCKKYHKSIVAAAYILEMQTDINKPARQAMPPLFICFMLTVSLVVVTELAPITYNFCSFSIFLWQHANLHYKKGNALLEHLFLICYIAAGNFCNFYGRLN